MAPAIVLGGAGLMPFATLALFAVLAADPWRAVALVLLTQYGALIAAFVGALHWGYAVERRAGGGEAWARYGFSVLPALAAWGALQFPAQQALLMLAAILVLCLVADFGLQRVAPLPRWFMRLRLVLTAGGAMSLLAGGLWR